MTGLIEDKSRFKSVKDINEFLKHNVHIKSIITSKNRKDELTIRDLEQFKNTCDYLNKLYKSLTQVIRN